MLKKIIIFIFFIFLYKNSYALVYSESAIVVKQSQNFTLSMSYESENICEEKKEEYNEKFPLYHRGNCFKRETDNNFYYFISKKLKKKNKLTGVNVNQFIGKFVEIKNLSKFTHLINNLSNSGSTIQKTENQKIDIAEDKIYLLNIYDDVDFILSFQKIVGGSEIQNYYEKHIYKIKEYLEKFRKEKKCSFDIVNVNPELKKFLYKNNVYIKTDLEKNMACYIYKNKANYYVRNLCTVYHKYRETNIKAGLYSMKLTYPILRKQSEINSLKGIFSNGVRYVDGLALRTKRDKRGRPIKGKIETFKVKGGGLCGVSTIFYNFTMYQPDLFKVTKRWAHMGYYKGYYGKLIGLDATIFGPTKNFKFINKSSQSIIWDYYGYRKGNKFCYGIKGWRLKPFPKQAVIDSKRYKKNCYKNTVFDSKTWKVKNVAYSCYNEIGW